MRSEGVLLISAAYRRLAKHSDDLHIEYSLDAFIEIQLINAF